MSAHPTIGIVTVLYNSDDVIEDFFASLARQRGATFKIYVIDNSPSNAALERCRELADRFGLPAEFVFNNANLGVAKGNNQGIELALRDRCRFVLLANNDVDFPAGTIDELMHALETGESIAAPKIRYYGAEQLIWYAGGAINPWTMRTTHRGNLAVDSGQYDMAGYTGYAPTCFVLVDAAIFTRVGLMDERYFVYYDDTDFMWRVRRAGIRIRYVPSARIDHKVSTSTGGAFTPFTVYYTNRNRVYFIRKHLHGVQKITALTYALATRVVQTVRLPKSLAGRLWAGVRDGLRMPLGSTNG